MCSHDWQQVNDVSVCIRCGLTKTPFGMCFDRKIVSYKCKKKRKGVKAGNDNRKIKM